MRDCKHISVRPELVPLGEKNIAKTYGGLLLSESQVGTTHTKIITPACIVVQVIPAKSYIFDARINSVRGNVDGDTLHASMTTFI